MSRKIFKKLYITGRLLNRIITFVIVVICSIFIYAVVNYIINFFGTTTSYLYEQNAHNVSHAYAKLTDSLVGTTKACIKILAKTGTNKFVLKKRTVSLVPPRALRRSQQRC